MGDQTEAIMNFWLQVSQGIEEAPYWRASTNLSAASPFVQAAPPSWSLLKMEPPAIDVSFTAGGAHNWNTKPGMKDLHATSSKCQGYNASIPKCQVLAGSACLQARAATSKWAASRASHLPAFLIHVSRVKSCIAVSCSKNRFYDLAKVCCGSRWNSAQRTSLFEFFTGMRWFENNHTTSELSSGTGWAVFGNILSERICLDVYDIFVCSLLKRSLDRAPRRRWFNNHSQRFGASISSYFRMPWTSHKNLTASFRTTLVLMVSPSAIQVTHPSTKRPIAARWDARTSGGSRHHLNSRWWCLPSVKTCCDFWTSLDPGLKPFRDFQPFQGFFPPKPSLIKGATCQ